MQADKHSTDFPTRYSEELANDFAQILCLPKAAERQFFFDVYLEVSNFHLFATWTLPAEKRKADLKTAFVELAKVQEAARSLLASLERLSEHAQLTMAISLITGLDGPTDSHDFSRTAIEYFPRLAKGIDNIASMGIELTVCKEQKKLPINPNSTDSLRVLPKVERGPDLWAFEHFAYQVARWARCYGGTVTVDKNSGSGTLVTLLRELARYLPLHACPPFVSDATSLKGLSRLDKIRQSAVEGITWPVWKKVSRSVLENKTA